MGKVDEQWEEECIPVTNVVEIPSKHASNRSGPMEKTAAVIHTMLQQGMNPSHSVHYSWGDDDEDDDDDDVTVTDVPSTRRGGAASHTHCRLMFNIDFLDVPF